MPQRVMITAAAAGIGRAAFREEFPEIAATHVNVANEAEVDAWFDEALEDLGGLDVLVNNAGIKGPTAPIDDVEFADWKECLAICLDSHFLCARRAAPVMKAQGSGNIINLSSTAGQYGFGNRTPYASAKWAVIGLTKSLAIELGPHGVRCNAVCPGAVRGDRINRVIQGEADIRGVAFDVIAREMTWSHSALCRTGRDSRHVPLPRQPRRQDGQRPRYRRRWPPRNHAHQVTPHGFQALRRTGHDHQDDA